MTPEQARTLAATVKADHAARFDDESRELLACRICWEMNPCSAYRLADATEALAARLDQPWSGWVYVGADDDLPPLASLAADGTADPP